MHPESVPFKTSKNVLMVQERTSFSISIANKARFASAHDVFLKVFLTSAVKLFWTDSGSAEEWGGEVLVVETTLNSDFKSRVSSFSLCKGSSRHGQ